MFLLQETLQLIHLKLITKIQMALSMRWNTISAIIASTSFMCLQDFIKKGFVFRNFTSSLKEENNTDKENKTAFQTLKSKWQISKQAMREIKQKGNGSYFKGLKKSYEQYDKNEQKNDLKLQKAVEKLQKSKQFTQKIKDQGQGSYFNGLKKIYKQFKEQKKSKTAASDTNTVVMTPAQAEPQQSFLAKKFADTKNAMIQKYKATTDLYKKTSEQKSQKLIMKHLYFAGLAICGAILAPRAYLLLNVAYFGAYQIYYFSDFINQEKKYTFLENMRFQPIWTTFMLGGAGIFALNIAKIARSA